MTLSSECAAVIAGRLNGFRVVEISSASRSTGRMRKGRLREGADKRALLRYRGREEKRRKERSDREPTTTMTTTTTETTTEKRGRCGTGRREVIGKRVREVRFNTRTSSSFYTRWFYIRPLSCYQPSAVWVHSYLHRHEKIRAPSYALAHSCTPTQMNAQGTYVCIYIAFARRF